MPKLLSALLASVVLLPSVGYASPLGEQLPTLLYEGTAKAQRAEFESACSAGEADACFGLGLIDLIATIETTSQALYRHGAAAPNTSAAGMLLGIPGGPTGGPANPDPEPIDYEGFRDIVAALVTGLDATRDSFIAAAEGDFVVTIDPLEVRVDFDGDGTASETETLAVLLREVQLIDSEFDFEESVKQESKGQGDKADRSVGFDRADAFWFAGYTQITATPIDLLLAHDFSEFFSAVMHRVFPKAGLAMQNYSASGSLMIDPESDSFFADVIAGIHTADFPVTDPERLKGVLERLKAITSLSRQNWEAILAETDDNRELVPSPSQTSIFPDIEVTEEVVAAWSATLDTFDKVLAGDLLVPHWRFRQGIDLTAYFNSATETDLVMLFTGHGALPFLAEGPVATAEDFAEANAVFGDDWLIFALWFN